MSDNMHVCFPSRGLSTVNLMQLLCLASVSWITACELQYLQVC